MIVGKPTAHSDHLGLYTSGFEIGQGVPNSYYDLTEWADQRMKNVNEAIIEKSQTILTYCSKYCIENNTVSTCIFSWIV